MVRAALIRNILVGLRAHSPGCQMRRDAWRLSLDEAAGIPGSRELDLVALDDGKTKVPGIKIHDTRLQRLMEALLLTRARRSTVSPRRRFISGSPRPSV